ncbi:MAG: perosamine synthetase [Thermotogaceae bacterium]|nr:perosamine synthetase [Thermotogaceae bacterium]
MEKYTKIVDFIKKIYNRNYVPLHEPVFLGNEKKYLLECIDTGYVSYIGEFVKRLEKITAEFTGALYAIAVVNGTAGLHVALKVVGVNPGDEVITQPLTFVATANAISHCGAYPVFVDVDIDTLGMSPESLRKFLKDYAEVKNGNLYNKSTGRRISAVVPVHVFGHPCRIEEIIEICSEYGLPVVEDAAEALGSWYKSKHCGTFGKIGVLSFNGNKTITTGGGGMILTNDSEIAHKIYHLTTTAKIPHPYEYIHDEIAYNYRLPNVNAAIGVAQMEKINEILNNKRQTAMLYKQFCEEEKIRFIVEPNHSKSNYWLNGIILENRKERDEFLEYTNSNGVHTRPIWRLMHKLDMYKGCFKLETPNSEWLEDRVVNLPSGVRVWQRK